MKTFISYRHTGEKSEFLREMLTAVRDALAQAGVESYCTFFDEDEIKRQSLTARQIMEQAFEKIEASDFLLVIQTSENKSEGMLMEVGYCLARGIPVVVAAQQDIKNTYLPQMATKVINWSDLTDLAQKIQTSDFSF